MSRDDEIFVRQLKQYGILRMFQVKDLRGFTRNGGVWNRCSDGDTDDSDYCRIFNKRLHEIKLPGGPLNLCPEFGGYKEVYVGLIIESIANLFMAKDTRTLISANHFPCGMAKKNNHSIQDVVRIAYLVNMRFRSDLMERLNSMLPENLHLRDDRVFDFFHAMKMKDGVIKQHTYVFDPDLYAEYFVRNRSRAA